jgi:hypothetical protein
MAHEELNQENLSPEEKRYNDFTRRGDDFFRIELFKSAKEMYEEALKQKQNDEPAFQKITECKKLIQRDTKRILFVLPFLILIVLSVIYLKVN